VSKFSNKASSQRKMSPRPPGSKPILGRACVDGIAKRLMGVIILPVLGEKVGVEQNGVGFVAPVTRIFERWETLLMTRLVNIMLEQRML
jgi:hypothetical protein